MKDAVRAYFPAFSDVFEGNVAFMYTDSLGLVTTGRGNLVDNGHARTHVTDDIGPCSPAMALVLPFKQAYTGGNFGALATQDQISAEWWNVKKMWPKVQSVACGKFTSLRLTQPDVDTLTFSKLDEMWAHLLTRFTDAEDWPADAQLGLLSMAWSAGPAFNFPKFQLAARARDWRGAALECQMTSGAVPVARNKANKTLFTNAQRTTDPEALAYPTAL